MFSSASVGRSQNHDRCSTVLYFQMSFSYFGHFSSSFSTFSPISTWCLSPVLTMKQLIYKSAAISFHLTVRSLTWRVWNSLSFSLVQRSKDNPSQASHQRTLVVVCSSAWLSQRHHCQKLFSLLCETHTLFGPPALSAKQTERWIQMNAVTPAIQFIPFVQWRNKEAKWLKHIHTHIEIK